MRKFIFVFVMTVYAFSVKAQDIVIHWLDSETKASAFGNGSRGDTVAAYMEFYQEDLMTFKTTGKSIVGINQIQFHIDDAAYTSVSGCRVIVLQGNALATATEVHSQVVASWQKKWNVVNLDTTVIVDPAKKLYIGYEVMTSAKSWPMTVANGSDEKQAWFTHGNGSTIMNVLEDYGYSFLIKARATTSVAPNDLMRFSSLDMSLYMVMGERLKGTVVNVGGNTITSFKVDYTVDGNPLATETYNVNLQPGQTYQFIHPSVTFNAAKPFSVMATVSKPNNASNGIIGTATRNQRTLVASEKTQRVVLHEVFTSSTCPPCKGGNERLTAVLDAVAKDKWACIKYQYNFPNTGDPYYTSECATRANFYGGIYSVPNMKGDGNQFDEHPGYYDIPTFNQLSNATALAVARDARAGIDVNAKKVTFSVTLDPKINANNPNLRFFAAVVEKSTVKNVKTNGETVFNYVMKKFMTSANGDPINTFAINTAIPVNLDYTFNGDYRLPANAGSPINHSIEHSVENFWCLMVVYWVQDIVTKDVYQAGKADPYPTISVTEADATSSVVIYPNPARENVNILTEAPVREVSIINMLGQKMGVYNNVATIPVSQLAKGIYMITVRTDNGVSNHKFVKE